MTLGDTFESEKTNLNETNQQSYLQQIHAKPNDEYLRKQAQEDLYERSKVTNAKLFNADLQSQSRIGDGLGLGTG